MPVPFLLHVSAHDETLAQRIARALQTDLQARGAKATVRAARTDMPGATVSAGLWDAEGTARWLTPLPVAEDADEARQTVVSFLERWGFVPRRAAAVRAS